MNKDRMRVEFGRTDWNKRPVDDGALEIEVVVDLVDLRAAAVEGGSVAPCRLDCALHLSECIRLARAGRDAGVRKPGVCRETLEEVHSRLEKGDSLSTLCASGWKAGRLESAVASAVRRPLVLPELLTGPVIVEPILKIEWTR